MTQAGSDTVVIELGEDGVSDKVLAALRDVQEQLSTHSLDLTLAFVVGYGMAAMHKDGLIR